MIDKGKPEAGKIYALTGGHDTPSIASGNTWAESEVKENGVLGAGTRQTEKNKTGSDLKEYQINVDLDSAREEAEDLESRTIMAKDEDDAMMQAAKIVKEEMYHGPYYNVMEKEEDDG